MGSLAGASEPAITTTSSITGGGVSAVVEIPGGDAGMVQTTTDPRGVEDLSDFNMLGQTLTTIAAFSTGVPTISTDQTTTFTYSGNSDEITQTALMPAGTPSQENLKGTRSV